MPSQFFRVENYKEAAGLLLALRAGLSAASLGRPLNTLLPLQISENEYKEECQNQQSTNSLNTEKRIVR